MDMGYYVKPWSDMFMRYLFGRAENKGLLLSFINAVLEDADFEPITDAEIRNPFNLANIAGGKESILDIKARDNKGRLYDIEVQSTGDTSFRERSLYYWAKNYSDQIEEGEHYKKLRPVICINILNFELVKDFKDRHACFLIREKNNPEYVLSNHFFLHFLELPKLNIEQSIESTKTRQTLPQLDKWLSFIKYEGKENDIMKYVIEDDPNIARAHEEYEKFTADDEMREMYEAREKARKDHNTLMRAAREEGLEEGEKKNAENNAKRMLEKGYMFEDIMDITGLSRQEVEALHADSARRD